jgi:hypothetical protein
LVKRAVVVAASSDASLVPWGELLEQFLPSSSLLLVDLPPSSLPFPESLPYIHLACPSFHCWVGPLEHLSIEQIKLVDKVK